MSASTAFFGLKKYPLILVCLALILSACGDGCISAAAATAAPAAASVTVSATSPKTLSFSWTAVAGAASYKLLKSADGVVADSQVSANLADTAILATDTIGIHVFDWMNALYTVQACNAGGYKYSSAVSTSSAY